MADITPARPMPLCGFAARCEADFRSVDDPLFVRALAVESDGLTVVVLSFDLLGLGPAAHDRVLAALSGRGSGSAPIRWLLCATHTHSAPAAIELLGCGALQPDYVTSLVPAACHAADQALATLRPARMRWCTHDVAGQAYNRRSVLDDGRVSMARTPDRPVVRRGPVWPRFLLARFDDKAGAGIAGIASWAAHPDTVCSPSVTADFPGELCRRLSETHGLPFLFLQGPCGNINPLFEHMTRGEMLANVDALSTSLQSLGWRGTVAPEPAMRFRQQTVPLAYAPAPPAGELREIRSGMRSVAESGDGPAGVMRILGDILNVPPGQRPEPGMARHIAAILADWSDRTLATARNPLPTVPMETAALRIGDLAFCFMAAEPLAETGLSIQAALPGLVVTPVGYASPLVGYLPTDDALREGGYEAAYAYRFYGRPAPFAPGSEPAVVREMIELIRQTD